MYVTCELTAIKESISEGRKTPDQSFPEYRLISKGYESILYYTPYQRESHGYVPRTNNQFRYPQSSGARVTANTPTYDGSTPWKDFLVQFEVVSELHGWSPLSMALNLAANLRGPAQALLADLPEEYRRNYQALTVASKQRFAPENQCELHKALLRNRSRKMTDSLPELAQDLRRQVVKA
ncbi:hypothetical protein BSL78_06861 [Apostichopus japonicus]|uniref:Uncharacterized protein n=1 Tax=Stichopus japonicus TaxID=307972 RepID=A0A2G8L7I4_STIJA|nr:hypothetical protein BSL78_06861 [Apostichopus japonicus]